MMFFLNFTPQSAIMPSHTSTLRGHDGQHRLPLGVLHVGPQHCAEDGKEQGQQSIQATECHSEPDSVAERSCDLRREQFVECVEHDGSPGHDVVISELHRGEAVQL